jgi:hypothetical protein
VRTAVSVLAVLLSAACGSSGTNPAGAAGGTHAASSTNTTASSGASGGGTSADLCSVLTPAQIQQAIGVPVGPGTKSTVPAVGCGWTDQSTENSSGVVLLYVDPVVYNGTKQANGQNGVTVTAVSGIGDEAIVETYSPGAKPLLLIKKGSVIVSLSADVRDGSGNTTPDKDLAAEKQLGAIVASAL